MSIKLEYVLIGIMLLLVIKYGIIGLNNWNNLFHPDRIEGNSSQYFLKPFLGIGS